MRRRRRQTLPASLIGSITEAAEKAREARGEALVDGAPEQESKRKRVDEPARSGIPPKRARANASGSRTRRQRERMQSRVVIGFLVVALGVPFFTMTGSRPAVAAGAISYAGHIGTVNPFCAGGGQTVIADADAELHEEQADTPFGGTSTLSVHASTADQVHRSVVGFPLPTPPSGCEVEAATMSLRTKTHAAGRTITASPVTTPWTEPTVQWNTPLSTGGPAASATTSNGWMDWDVSAQVQSMYTSGTNNGFLLTDSNETAANTVHAFDSRESTNDPELTIHWETIASTSTTLTTTAAVAKGNSIVLSFGSDDDTGGAISATDSAGNVYTLDAAATNTSGVRTAVLSAHNVNALPAGGTITVSHPASGRRAVSGNQFAGLAESTALDATNAAAGSSSAPNSGSVSTSQPNTLLVGSFTIAGGSTLTLGGGFTAMPGVAGYSGRLATQYRIVSSSGSYASTGSLSSSASWAAGVAAYKMDTTLPIVQIDTPGEGSIAPASPTFSGDSGDHNSDSETVKLKLYSGVTPTGTPLEVVNTTRAPNGSWTHDHTTPLGDGVYTLQAEQDDGAGNTGLSNPITFSVDTLAPAPPSVIGPSPDPGSDTSVTWGFAGEPGGTYECELSKDGVVLADYAPCVTPVSYSLADGDGIYTFAVRQTDDAGNVGTEGSDDYVLDTQAPEDPVVTGPDPDLGNNPNVVWSFTSEPGAITECQLSKGVQVISPLGSCTSPVPYTLIDGDGTYTFSVRQTDRAGNTSGIAGDDYVLDTDAPATTIDSGPNGLINTSDPTFTFSSDDPQATFECDFDGNGFTACSSPVNYTSLADGFHTFSVRSVDQAGNVDLSPVNWSFTVDTGAPPLSIDDAPSDPGNQTNVAWQFSSEPGAAIDCELSHEGTVVSAFTDCSSGSVTYNLGPDGQYSFLVRATDAAGNSSIATDTYLLDSTRPQSQASSPSLTSSPTITVAYSVQEAGAGTAEVELWVSTPAGGGWTLAAVDSSLSGSFAYSAVDGDGAYSFYTRSRDAAGNYENAPANFDAETILDTVAPSLTLESAPSEPTSDPVLSFTFSSTDPAAAFSCSLTSDGSEAFAPCSSPASYPAPATTTTYTFKVVASDTAGNASPLSTWSFTYLEPQPTPEPTETITPTPTETITPEPTETITPTPTETITPTPTETITPTPEPTEEPTPVPTETITPTPEPTEEPIPPVEPPPPPTGGGPTTVVVDEPDDPMPERRQPPEKKEEPREPQERKLPPEDLPEHLPLGNDEPATSRIAQLAKLAAEAVKTFAFPLLLAILVIVFLLVQHWIDKKDPKLAMAPVHSNHDLARFG